MRNINEFIKVVDEIRKKTNPIPNDLNAAYQYFKIPVSSTMSSHCILDKLGKIISNAFSDPLDAEIECVSLLKQLIFMHVLEDFPLHPYVDILDCIKLSCRDDAPAEYSNSNWENAIVGAWLKINRFKDNVLPDEVIFRTFARKIAVAQSIKYLRKLGYTIEIDHDHPKLSEDVIEPIALDIEQNIKYLGGINVAEAVFAYLKRFYNQDQERYHLVRRISMVSNGPNPDVPFGYILQLASKYPFSRSIAHDDIQEKYSQLIDLSTNLAALFDLQVYSQAELMFKNANNIVEFIKLISLFDTLFLLPQGKPEDYLKIIKAIVEWFGNINLPSNIGTLKDAMIVAEAVINMIGKRNGPIIITARRLQVYLPEGIKTKAHKFLDEIFSHSMPGANQNYVYPTDYLKANYMFHPLLSDGRGSFLILDRNLVAIAFLESILKKLRKIEMAKDPDVEIGYALEKFIDAEFNKHGIDAISGKYLDGDDECDFIIETEDQVILIEVKKKSLTRSARSGDDVSLFNDLGKSLIHAMNQAGKHELKLLKTGTLNIKDSKGTQHVIELSGRKIEKVAVTFLEYGCLHDRVVLRHFLTSIVSADFEANTKSGNRRLRDFKKYAKETREQYNELSIISEENNRKPFFNCWFISVAQLLVILKGVNSNKSFRDSLFASRHLTTGTLDLYYEHWYAKYLKNYKGPPD